MKNNHICMLLSVTAISILLLSSFVAIVSGPVGTYNDADEDGILGADYLVYNTNGNYIPIYTIEDLYRVGKGTTIPELPGVLWSLSAKYILMDDMDLSSYSSGGSSLTITVPFTPGLPNTANVEVILSSAATEMYLWFDDRMYNANNTDRIMVNNLPFGEYTMVVGGIIGGVRFAYSVDLYSYSAGTFRTTIEIDSGFLPIGVTRGGTAANPTYSVAAFTGEFDGNGKEIIGLSYSTYAGVIERWQAAGGVHIGMFALLGNGAEVYNLGLMGSSFVSITPYIGAVVYGGSIAARTTGNVTIERCYAVGPVTATSAPMGTGSATTTMYLGGLVGYANGTTTIIDSVNAGQITAISNGQNGNYTLTMGVGGILGGSDGTLRIEECFNAGSVIMRGTGNSPMNGGVLSLGGIVGRGVGTSTLIYNSYNIGAITSSFTKTGGGGVPAFNVGGIAGRMDSTTAAIVNCYALDEAPANPEEQYMIRVTTTNNVTANIGGILGNATGSTHIVNSYFTTGRITYTRGSITTTPNNLSGIGTVTNPGSVSGAKTATQMKTVGTYNQSNTAVPTLTSLFPSGVVPGWSIANDDSKLWTTDPALSYDEYPKLIAYTGDDTIFMWVTVRSESGFTIEPLGTYRNIDLGNGYIRYYVPLGERFDYTFTVNPRFEWFVQNREISLHVGNYFYTFPPGGTGFTYQHSDIYGDDAYTYANNIPKVKRAYTIFPTGIGFDVEMDSASIIRGGFEWEIEGNVPATYDGEVDLKIKMDVKYVKMEISISRGGTIAPGEIYVITNDWTEKTIKVDLIQTDIIIFVYAERTAYDITFSASSENHYVAGTLTGDPPLGPGIDGLLSTVVQSGDDFEFSFKLRPEYAGGIPLVTLNYGTGVIWWIGYPTVPSDGVYEYNLTTVHDNYIIDIDAVYTVEIDTTDTHIMNWNWSAEEWVVSPTESILVVRHGYDLYISFEMETGYTAKITVTMGGASFEGYIYDEFGGMLTIGNVIGNVEVTVTSVMIYYVEYLPNEPSGASGTVSGTMDDSTHESDTSSALIMNLYELTGWSFTGWNTATDGSGDAYTNGQSVLDLTSTPGATITLYAIWQANTYTVVYDSNKPSAATGTISGTMANSVLTYDDPTGKLRISAFALTGWAFAGWATSAGGTVDYDDEEVKPNIATTGTVTIYAVWAKTPYTVSYDANKPSAASGTISGTMASTTLDYDDPAGELSTNAFTLIGWEFAGWNTASNGSGVAYADGAVMPNIVTGGTITLYAQWTANTYTVIYDANEPATASGTVSGTTADSTHVYDISSALTMNLYELTGWTFKGWATSAGGSVVYDDEADVLNLTDVDGDAVTLYAQWERMTFTVIISHSGNGGTLTYTVTDAGTVIFSGTLDAAAPSVTLTIPYGAILEATANIPSGYNFEGWDDGRPVRLLEPVYTVAVSSHVDVTGEFSEAKKSFALWIILIASIIMISLLLIDWWRRKKEEEEE
ncbi:MAG: InlB B-repeat-containing protein [Methanomassiliicoccaceae archaeon]|nr:InlB B-repeat-containing protein [Methanomassiliicoccaceae archaeon]